MVNPRAISLKYSSKDFIFETGVHFRGLTISQTEKGYNVILRATLRGGTPVYSMVTADDPAQGLEVLLRLVSGRKGNISWHKDRFATSRSG